MLARLFWSVVLLFAILYCDDLNCEAMAGNKTGESKWIAAGKLIELLSRLHPETMVTANDHHNLSLYDPGPMPEKYIGVINIRTEEIEVR